MGRCRRDAECLEVVLGRLTSDVVRRTDHLAAVIGCVYVFIL